MIARVARQEISLLLEELPAVGILGHVKWANHISDRNCDYSYIEPIYLDLANVADKLNEPEEYHKNKPIILGIQLDLRTVSLK